MHTVILSTLEIIGISCLPLLSAVVVIILDSVWQKIETYTVWKFRTTHLLPLLIFKSFKALFKFHSNY